MYQLLHNNFFISRNRFTTFVKIHFMKHVSLKSIEDIFNVVKDVTVYDLMGRMIQKIDLSNMESEISIDVSAFENASYFMVIKTSQGTTNKQLIINN